MESVLVVEELSKTYRKGFIPKPVLALNKASFEVRKGRITGFIGANGAGKTTTIRCLLNFTHSDSGRFSFFGATGFSMKARQRVGYLPEHPYFYNFLSGVEFLRFYSKLSQRKITESHIQMSLKAVHLESAAFRPLSSYSKGMLQRVGLAQALIHEPDLLILDEPMSGLDPDGRALVRKILKEVSSRGVTLFFSTHLLDDAEDLCQDLVLMSQGKVKYCGSLKEAFPSSSMKYVIEYKRRGSDLLESKECHSEEEFNLALRQFISEKSTIVQALPIRQSLESLFYKINQDSR